MHWNIWPRIKRFHNKELLFDLIWPSISRSFNSIQLILNPSSKRNWLKCLSTTHFDSFRADCWLAKSMMSLSREHQFVNPPQSFTYIISATNTQLKNWEGFSNLCSLDSAIIDLTNQQQALNESKLVPRQLIK